ncbi:hypothetical protein HOV55_gp67 [Erwinia phage vB_EhrS_59]|uniref:Uncharacterized protein n=1 Tax=Erwinia phage vB_EhrS_59 TaxID=2283025 RepID=A0A4Y1NSG5_9CAUD|nr:hypothetical protein HOV55_gp67 [Erwinia phage vB_EhrS_59]AXH43585.1 hypothetical protein MZUP2_670 [Erwinia phage vB_EhrS_59]
MTNKPPYTPKETEYLLRVSRKVPVEVLARQLKRTKCSVMKYCCKQGISVHVPIATLRRDYPEVIAQRKKMRTKSCR